MSKPVKRKLSAFPCLISHTHGHDPEQDEALFDFDAPTFADLSTLIQNPPYCPDILNVAINTKNHDDYWFTYSHYQHEEDEDSTDATKLSKRTSSIHGRLHTNAKQNEGATKHSALETAVKIETKKVVEPTHKDEKKTSKQNDLLKSNKKRFTMNTSKAQDFSFAASKNLMGDKPGALDFGTAAVQKRILNVRPNEPAAHHQQQQQHQKKEAVTQQQQQQQSNADAGKRTLKRKGITSSSEINVNEMRMIQSSKPGNTNNAVVKNSNTLVVENENITRLEPVLKRVKGNMSPQRDDKKNEKVKIDLRNTTPVMNKSSTSMTSTNREMGMMGTTDLVRAVQQATREKNERDAKLRRSISVASTRLPLPLPHQPTVRNNSKEKTIVDKNVMDEEGKKSKRRDESVASLKEEKGTNTSNHNIKIMYEPAKYSARDVRKWEKESGKSWYKLTFQERHQANLDIEKMIKDAKKI